MGSAAEALEWIQPLAAGALKYAVCEHLLWQGRTEQIERALRVEVADALITIHVEPEEKAKHTGVVVV